MHLELLLLMLFPFPSFSSPAFPTVQIWNHLLHCPLYHSDRQTSAVVIVVAQFQLSRRFMAVSSLLCLSQPSWLTEDATVNLASACEEEEAVAKLQVARSSDHRLIKLSGIVYHERVLPSPPSLYFLSLYRLWRVTFSPSCDHRCSPY